LLLSPKPIITFWEGEVQTQPKGVFKPPVSIIVPAYNSEKLIPTCLTSLFQSASKYMGFCEIIVVDDGSSDYTYEMAWATIHECRRKWPQIHGKVVRHTAKLGRNQALKTGVNKAFGTLIAVVDGQTAWKPSAIKELIEAIERGEKTPLKSASILYRADALRKLLT
jgi:glycosyltransferase involved in cell wall biosynthesis